MRKRREFLSQLDGGIVDMPVKILTFSRMFTKSRAATLRNRRRKSACSSCVVDIAKALDHILKLSGDRT